MTVPQFFFILFALITLLSGLRCVTTPNLFHAALYLVISLFGVAALFAMLEAGFLALAQLIVYVGAIAILIIFAVMLTRGMVQPSGAQLNSQAGLAAVVSGALLFILLRVLPSFNYPTVDAAVPADLTTRLGQSLVGEFVLPFEVTSVLLLAALVGAIYIARERSKKTPSPPGPLSQNRKDDFGRGGAADSPLQSIAVVDGRGTGGEVVVKED